MASALSADMIHLMLRGLMKPVDETPANDANIALLQQSLQTLEWLQAQAQVIDNRLETAAMFSTSISVISQTIDRINEQARAKVASRMHEQDHVEPLDLVKLFAAWDREFPGGSAGVLAQMEETM